MGLSKLQNSFLVLLMMLFIGCQTKKKEQPLTNDVIMQSLLVQEDTDGDKKITIDDKGPKEFGIKDLKGNEHIIKGTYHLSNLLQELAIVTGNTKPEIQIPLDISKITELPTNRISRLIKTRYWDNLTRSIDRTGLSRVLQDTKSSVDTFRLYIPKGDKGAMDYFASVQSLIPKLQIVPLPEKITPQYVKSINNKPGILNLAHKNDENGNYIATPFVVPGGRFNEMYGWDSYFESVGLLLDNRADLAMAMADNFAYQIRHYGKILNANRSYYLTRTQPPFFSSLLKEIYQNNPSVSKKWLAENLKMVLKEYETVWMEKGVRLTENGLSRFYGEGIGIPPETEEGHFDFVLKKYAKKHQVSLNEFIQKYQSGIIEDYELDMYFTHDRSMRESGHDTSNRLDDVCTYLNTVGLNSLLFKYETDIAYLIKEVFKDKFAYGNLTYSSSDWLVKAEKRKDLINNYLWNEEKGSFYDYNFKTKNQQQIAAATNIYPLWAGLASKHQAAKLVENMFQELAQKGGITGTSDILDKTNSDGPQRQWDYPNGWAPHQMLIWRGLLNYGYEKEAQELIYRWLWTITRNAVNYNGVIPEKYDVVASTHKVFAEYGNVGTEFDYITPSGFGWMNASYQLGLSLLENQYKNKLNELTDPDKIFTKR